ncbi:putative translation initiation inhibitor [Burkholderia cepacia]|nr:putative translation initiation inhibitor [Burkholderia cepacia]
MNRDEKLIQIAAEFGFNPDEEIRIGGKYTPFWSTGIRPILPARFRGSAKWCISLA